jgi:hypothetical protein
MTGANGETQDGERYTAFATRDWFSAWIEAFGGARAGIWESRPSGVDDGAIAYQREHVALSPLLRVPAALSATNDHTPRYDAIGKISDPTALFERMMSELGVSMLRFDYVPSQSHILSGLRERESRLWYGIDFCEDSPYVNCDLDWDTYWDSLGSTRSLWARRERKLMTDMKAAFRCLSDWSEVEPLLDRVYAVEASGWKGREGTAINQSEETLRFYNRCIHDWAERGWLRLFTLSLGTEIVAFQINVLFRGVLSQLKVGYDEGRSKLSPGQVLQLQLLRWAFANPEVHVYDMLGGGGKAGVTKRKWATDAEPLYSVTVFRRNLPGLLARMRFVTAPRLKRWLTGNPGKTHQPVQSRAEE